MESGDIRAILIKKAKEGVHACACHFQRIREQYLAPCYEDLLAGREESCKVRYVQMVRDLEREYLS